MELEEVAVQASAGAMQLHRFEGIALSVITLARVQLQNPVSITRAGVGMGRMTSLPSATGMTISTLGQQTFDAPPLPQSDARREIP